MRLLALDTSTDACTVALAVGEAATVRESTTPRVHAKRVLGMVHELLAEASLTLGALDAIAVGCGPGSFTGVRIACGVAQGLAFAADLPVLPLSSLQIAGARFVPHAYAKESPQRRARSLLVAQDARLGEVYWGAFAPHPTRVLEVLVGDRADAPSALVAHWQEQGRPGPDLLLGSAPALYGQLQALVGAVALAMPALPSAVDALALGRAAFDAGAELPPERALPVYFRAPV